MDDVINVLLVEDDEADQMAFERHVKKSGIPFSFSIAASVAGAKELLQVRTFDVVVTDYQLPDGTALDMIKAVGDVPTVVVTGQGNERIAVDAMKAGARDYLVKDHDRNYLHMMPITVKNALDRSRLEKDRERLINELKQALADVKTLTGLLPICAKCKKIRDDKGYWTHVEKFIIAHSDAKFTHGYCPECFNELIDSCNDEASGQSSIQESNVQ